MLVDVTSLNHILSENYVRLACFGYDHCMRRRTFLAGCAGVSSAFASGCLAGGGGGDAAVLGERLTLTTTTSTYDTGLLGELHEAFEARFGAAVDTVAQGTGAALATGRRGDSDVVMVHARELEDEFISDGYGINRRELMFNDFVIVGPGDDPAGIDALQDAPAAFAAIAEAEAVFVSRGDNSGTHLKELDIWEAAGIDPSGDWYRATGSGMGEVINQADLEAGAYALTDRGTYLAMRATIELEILLDGPIGDGDDLLANPYGIVAVNPGRHEAVNYDLAMAYIGFLTSIDGQRIIEEFEVDGEQLFFPEAVAADPNFQQYVPANWESS